MDSPTRLLAKSSQTPDTPRHEETLEGHTASVIGSARVLLCARAEQSLHAARLPEIDRSRLERIVLLAAFVHDLGKCSDHFQAMIRRQRAAPQLMRHEALSLWLCWFGQPLHAWLQPAVGADEDFAIAIVAAAGHHRRFWDDALARDDSGAGTSLTLLTDHPDFVNLLCAGARQLKIAPPPVLGHHAVCVTRRTDPRRAFESWEDQVRSWIEPGSASSRLLAIAKALVLDADVAGSALPCSGENPGWIAEQLARRASAGRMRGIVARRLEHMAARDLRPFQREVAASAAPVTLVTAGCGTGKTVAAYQWCAEQHAGRQLWLTYPTTGTTTEGFRDYVHGADIVGRLEHGRAEIDLEILGLGDGEQGCRDRDRLDALRAWGAETVTCTVDTVLGLIQNQRKGLYAWAGLSDAAVVFDEIHSYDDVLFGNLLRFLEALPGVAVLLMTASLPAARLRSLRSLVERVHGQPLAEVAGPSDLEALPRYRLRSADDPWAEVDACLSAGAKVLWVSNTVGRCLDLADRKVPDGARVLIYHSRFRYIDRVERHAEMIDAFRRPGPALAVTTQVAEMSLDVSADLLITDLAPIPALIQRLGRLNRRSTPDEPAPVRPFVVLPFRGQPYEQRHLDEAGAWIESLAGRDLNQRDLVEAWHQAPVGVPADVRSEWLDGGFRTLAAPVRESSPGITVVLASDAPAVRRRERRPEEVALPMNPPPPSRAAWWDWAQVQHFPVAPAEFVSYDPRRGARWLP